MGRRCNRELESTAGLKMFAQRLYNWLDGFGVVKMIHYMRDNYYPEMQMDEAPMNCRKG